ncbi:MAG TPA: hypothetical protein VHL54_10385 [Actinomycetota bacterium]|nr:hypothetical protein [Actinomycetota bacterium]
MPRRIGTLAAMAGVAVLGLANPASAHPVTGGEATPLQMAVTVIGALLSLGGVGVALVATGESERFASNRTRYRRGGLSLAIVGFVVFLFAPDWVEPAPLPCERPASEADITIVSPSEDAVLPSGEVELELELEGGEIASLSTVENRPDEGHLHITVDGRLASMTGSEDQTIQVEPGEHDLEVEYVANDHAPFCKRVVDRVRFTVEEGAA